jgi:predicted nucleic acid-binding protein
MTIHPLTLSEVLVGGVRQGRGHALRSAIAAAGVTTESGDLVDPLILAEVRAHTSLSMPDAVVLASARALGAALATFDDRLRSRAAEAGLTVRPEA